VAVQPAQPAEKVPKARPEKAPQPCQPARRLSHHRLRPPPPRTRDRAQQPFELRGKRRLRATQPTAHPPHPNGATLPRDLGARTWTLRGQARLDGAKRQIAIGANILRQHRMADTATRAPHAAQPLPLSSQIAPVPPMAPQDGPPTLRIRTAQFRNRTTVHPLSILLAAPTSNAYHGLLSEAPRVSSRSAKTTGVPGGLRLPCPPLDREKRPALPRRRIYPTTLHTGKNSGHGHETRRASTPGR
jgi:hypothetical protein